ncbi:MAG: hypothetical protein AAFN09_12995 [Pseudomonadota bacterium]
MRRGPAEAGKLSSGEFERPSGEAQARRNGDRVIVDMLHPYAQLSVDVFARMDAFAAQ